MSALDVVTEVGKTYLWKRDCHSFYGATTTREALDSKPIKSRSTASGLGYL